MPKQKLKPRSDGRYRKVVDGVAFYGYTEREVYQKIKDHEVQRERGRLFSKVADEWWNLEVEMLSPSTVKGYKKATERVIKEFGRMHIKEVQTSDITRFLYYLGKKLGYAKKTVKNHKIILNRIFHFAVVQGEIQYNPARESEIPRGLTSTPRLPASPQEEAIISKSQEIWLLPFMALFTGMRKGELRGLKWEDIDLTRKLIHVQRSVWDGSGTHIKSPKTQAGNRLIPIPDVLYQELERHRKKGPPASHYVFGGEKPISEKKYRYTYAKFQKQTGITATAQQLRKSYATMAVSVNMAPDVLASIFGHEDITTTLNIYSQVREDRIIAAGNQLNLVSAAQTKNNKTAPEKTQ